MNSITVMFSIRNIALAAFLAFNFAGAVAIAEGIVTTDTDDNIVQEDFQHQHRGRLLRANAKDDISKQPGILGADGDGKTPDLIRAGTYGTAPAAVDDAAANFDVTTSAIGSAASSTATSTTAAATADETQRVIVAIRHGQDQGDDDDNDADPIVDTTRGISLLSGDAAARRMSLLSRDDAAAVTEVSLAISHAQYQVPGDDVDAVADTTHRVSRSLSSAAAFEKTANPNLLRTITSKADSDSSKTAMASRPCKKSLEGGMPPLQ